MGSLLILTKHELKKLTQMVDHAVTELDEMHELSSSERESEKVRLFREGMKSLRKNKEGANNGRH
jgi:hypothetical protein